MSAIDELNAFLRKSPSCIEPWEIRQYLSAIEAENARLKQELEAVGTAAYLYGRDDLKANNAKLTKLVRWMYQVMDESCAVHYPYEPTPVSMQALMRAEKEMQALGIEVPE